MGISDVTNRQSYIGDGSSTVFPFPHYFFSPSDLIVNLYDINSCLIQSQQLNTNYTVSGNVSSQGVYPAGGSVVMNSAFPSSLEIVIVRAPAEVQNFALAPGQPINSLALVQQLDYLTALVQRQQDLNSRSIVLPDGVGPINGSTFSTVLPANISKVSESASKVLAVNSGATGFELVTMGSSSGGGGVTFPITVAQGGTGAALAITKGQVIVATDPLTMAATVGGAVGQVLTFQGSSSPTWTTVVNSGGGGTVGSTSLTNQVSGILPVPNGGTGIPILLPSQVLFGSTTTQVGQTTLGVVGQVLTYQGSSAPTWTTPSVSATGSTDLTNQVKGILPVPNGGTGQGANFVVGQVIFACSATQMGYVPPGSPGQFLTYVGSSTPTWTTVVNSGGGGFTGSISLTNQVSGILPIANGGTGNPAFSGSTLSITTSLTSVAESSASIGLTNNSSGMRFGQAYLTNDVWVGPYTGVNDFIRISRNAAPGPNPGIIFSGSPQGYLVFNFGNEWRVNNVGGGQTIFRSSDHWFGGTDVTTGFNYLVASTANATNIANVTVGANTHYTGQLSLASAAAGGQTVTISNSGTVAAYIVYMPPAQAVGQTALINDGAGNLSWTTPFTVGSNAPLVTSTKSANYNAVVSDEMIFAQSGCGLIGLYGPAGNTGRSIRVKHITNGGDRVTISCSSTNIDGTSVILVGQYESYSMVSDGASWQVTDHQFPPISMRWMVASLAPSAAYQTIAWRTADYDPNAIMNSVSGTMTMPRPGKWRIEANLVVSHTAIASDSVQLAIFKNGNAMSETVSEVAANQNNIICMVSDNLNLTLNDQITVRHINANTAAAIRAGSSNSYVTAVYLGQ